MIWVVLTLLVAVQAVAGAFWWRLLKRGPVGWVEAGNRGAVSVRWGVTGHDEHAGRH